MESLPEGISLAALAVLLVRGLLMAAPRIVDAISKALTERELAKRITAQASLAAVERDAAHDRRQEGEIDGLRAAVEEMRASLDERERLATEAIHAADHAHTRERLDACERDLAKCTDEHAATKRALTAMSAELLAIRKEMIR